VTVVCGQCGAELVPRAPHPGGLDMWEPHECRGMTEDVARERLAFYATFSDAVDQITTAYDALAVLVDPAEILAAMARAGKVERWWTRGDPPMTHGYTYWRLVPREHGSEES